MRHSIIFCVVMLVTVLGVAACSAETQGPTIWLDYPLDGAQVPLQPLTIQAHASDADGVARFEFFVGETSLVTVSGSGRRLADAQVEWTPPMPGTYVVRARAVDSNGNVGSESSSHIVVSEALTPMSIPATVQPPILTPALTATSTPKPTLTLPPTQCWPTVVANVPVNVRSGPGTVYSAIAALSEGQSAAVSGKNADSTWWYIDIPGGAGGHGWVSASVVTASCIPTSLAVIAAPPTPTSTITFGPIFTVPALDTTPPNIANAGSDRSEINQEGQYCATTQHATVSATVTDAGGVNRVVARYSGPASGEVEMFPVGGNVYQGTIGPIAQIGDLSIYVVAWDKVGNVAQSSPFIVRVVVCLY